MQDSLKDILLTFSFISRLPVKLGELSDWEVRMKRIPAYFPIVGYVPGLIYFAGGFLSLKFGIIAPLLSIVLGFYLFDLFHFDGLLDTLDGFLNQSSKSRRLEIMSKGNVGPFAVFYGVLYVIVFWELITSIKPVAFVFGSVFGRYTMDVVLVFSKPAKNEGLGAMLFPFNRFLLVPATLFTLPLLLIDVKLFLVSIFSSWLVGFLISKVSEKQIDGVTGDVLGGSCLIGQIVVLLILNYLI